MMARRGLSRNYFKRELVDTLLLLKGRSPKCESHAESKPYCHHTLFILTEFLI